MPEVPALLKYVIGVEGGLPSHTLDPPDRAGFARAVADYCDLVIRTIPTNTPAEDAWVRKATHKTLTD
jgi:hypothetical protein